MLDVEVTTSKLGFNSRRRRSRIRKIGGNENRVATAACDAWNDVQQLASVQATCECPYQLETECPVMGQEQVTISDRDGLLFSLASSYRASTRSPIITSVRLVVARDVIKIRPAQSTLGPPTCLIHAVYPPSHRSSHIEAG